MLSQLLEQVREYLAGGSIDKLESWVLCHLHQIIKSGDKRAVALADEIDADLVFMEEGLLSEAEFKRKLKGFYEFLNPVVIKTAEWCSAGHNIYYLGSSNNVVYKINYPPFMMVDGKAEQHADTLP